MKEDFSYGIIPLMQKDGTWYTIMIKLSSGLHRWLPKGHPNEGETIIQTALREISEETWLTIDPKNVDTTTLYEEHYEFFNYKKKSMISKTVWYYMAIIPYSDSSTLWGSSQEDGEILDKKVISIKDAIQLATYDPTRTILEKIHTKLENQN